MAERYARAARLLDPMVGGLLRNADVVPAWIGESDRFWYQRDVDGGHDYVVVDASTGAARPAFDHVAMARSLGDAAGRTIDPLELPLAAMVLREADLEVTVDGTRLVCDLGGRECRSVPTPDPDLAWSPDGRWAVASRDGDLWLHAAQAEPVRLTDDGSADDGYGIYYDNWKAGFVPRLREGPQSPMGVEWAPDGSRFVVPRIDQRHVAPYPLLDSVPAGGGLRPQVHLPRLPLIGEAEATIRWYVVDVPSGERRLVDLPYDDLLDLQQDMTALRATWFTSDGSHLHAAAFGKDMRSAFLFDLDLATGAVRTVIEERGDPRVDLHSSTYNPPNVRVLGDGREVVWFSQRSGWGHLYLYDGDGRLLRPLTSGDWLVRDIVHVDETRRQVFVTGSGREGGNPYYRHLYRVGMDDGTVHLLSPEPEDVLVTSPYNDVLALEGGHAYRPVSPSSRFVVYSASPLRRGGTSVVRSADDGRLVATFEQSDVSALLAAGYRPPEEFVAVAADGVTPLHGVLYLPADLDPAGSYPIVDCEYASPLTATVPRNMVRAVSAVAAPAPGALASLGFAVVVVDARGTTFRDREFSFANFGRLGVCGIDDHVAAIRQLAERHPFLDLSRVGIYGRSYGGWSAIRAMLEFPDVFTVGVAGAPIGSLQAHYADYHQYTYQGRPRYSDGTDRRPTPLAVPENWADADSEAQAARLAGKLQITVAELDENAVPGSVMRFLDALIRADKDVDLVYLPSTNHFFRHHRYATRRMTDFLVRHLLGVEPPPHGFDQTQSG
jgi:dipeptidyl-peptidase 4